MRNSWTKTFRRLAAGAVVAGATAMSSAMCYANAYDDPNDPAYQADDANNGNDGNPLNNTNGWVAGDNGGTGFTAWNFDSSYWWYGDGNWYPYANPGFKRIDDGLGNSVVDSNPNNDIGKAWVVGQTAVLKDVNRAGRGFLQPLQIGQTFRIVIDNPTERPLGGGYTGYFLKLNGGSGGVNGNICSGSDMSCTPGDTTPAVTEMGFNVFHGPGGDPGGWHVDDASGVDTLLNDTDTAAAGAVFEVTRTGASTYDVLLDPIGPGPLYSASHTFANPSQPIDWFEIRFFNSSATATSPPNQGFSDMATTPTDLYISKMEIVPEPGTGVLLVLGAGTLVGAGRRRRKEA
jgi:hypothetical protein